jgi:hypothetical protein
MPSAMPDTGRGTCRPEVADDALEPEPVAIEIGLLHPNIHHCGRLGATDQRQSIVECPVGFARSVPGDEHTFADALEGAGIRDDENRPSAVVIRSSARSQVRPSELSPGYCSTIARSSPRQAGSALPDRCGRGCAISPSSAHSGSSPRKRCSPVSTTSASDNQLEMLKDPVLASTIDVPLKAKLCRIDPWVKTFRCKVQTPPGSRFKIRAETDRRIEAALDENGIAVADNTFLVALYQLVWWLSTSLRPASRPVSNPQSALPRFLDADLSFLGLHA